MNKNLIEHILNYIKSNLDDFNEVLEENYTEEDINNCLGSIKQS